MAFNTLLRILDLFADKPHFDGNIVIRREPVHHALHMIHAESAHEVILKRNEESGCARVALTAGTSAELVINTP